jgi:serine/threonine-protein kinase
VNALDGGHSVGRYRIISFLGAGAMGEVYLADDPQIDRRLAIKTVRLAGRPQEIEDRKKRLLREARAAGRLLHPNVVTLFDAGEAEGLLYLAFEYVEGVDLAHRLDEDAGPRLSLREVLRIVRQAADALDYAHGQGIVHRDIKPSNILLDRAGRVKVADFGIAKMAGQSTELTMAGSVMGSPQYLSPEQIRGEDLDGRSDIFSLGVVLYEMLSGKRPFEGDTITTLVYQILHKEPPPISELRAVPPRLEELLRRMLAKSAAERLGTAGEAARELAFIEAELSDETLSAPAGAGPLDATRVLSRSTTGAGSPALGTVPASPATTPSVPPPMPTAAAAIPTASIPVPPAAPEPAFVPAAPPPGPKRLPVGLLIAAVLLVMVAALGAVGYTFWRSRTAAEPSAAQVAQGAPSVVKPVAVPLPANTQGTQGTAGTPGTVTTTVPGASPAPAAAPAPSLSPAQTLPQKISPPPPQPQPRTVPPPAPEPPRTQGRVPGPAAAPVPERPAVVPAPAAPRELRAPREEEAEPAPPAADQSIRTGMEVTFHVLPQDAHVLVDGRVIGEAQDWSGQRGARSYTFPGAGSYVVKIRKPGMKDYRIAVEAGAVQGKTPIAARLQPMGAAEVDATDLRTFRVREAVAFRVQPPAAEASLTVDGQPVGLAKRFGGGGFLRAGAREWLELPPGKHRLSFVSPGYHRQDILVEVVETADRARERIDVVLAPGGSGE